MSHIYIDVSASTSHSIYSAEPCMFCLEVGDDKTDVQCCNMPCSCRIHTHVQCLETWDRIQPRSCPLCRHRDVDINIDIADVENNIDSSPIVQAQEPTQCNIYMIACTLCFTLFVVTIIGIFFYVSHNWPVPPSLQKIESASAVRFKDKYTLPIHL